MFIEASVMSYQRRPRTLGMGRRPCSVLLVDDDIFMLGVLDDMLQDFGATRITKAMGSMAALAALDAMALPPELIFCDLNMPGGDGFDFLEALGMRRFKGAVVLMSGMSIETMHSATLMARFNRLRVAGSLCKPVSAASLAAVLGNLA